MLANFDKNMIISSIIKQFKNFIILTCKKEYLLLNLYILKFHQFYRFQMLSTISCVDFPQLKERFELNYQLLSLDFNFNINVRIKCSEFSQINSITLLYKSGVWLEREIWDMFGIFFKNNYDLRRILTDYGFPYHPLRKTFPLHGFASIYYDFLKKKILYTINKYHQVRNNKKFSTNWIQLNQRYFSTCTRFEKPCLIYNIFIRTYVFNSAIHIPTVFIQDKNYFIKEKNLTINFPITQKICKPYICVINNNLNETDSELASMGYLFILINKKNKKEKIRFICNKQMDNSNNYYNEDDDVLLINDEEEDTDFIENDIIINENRNTIRDNRRMLHYGTYRKHLVCINGNEYFTDKEEVQEDNGIQDIDDFNYPSIQDSKYSNLKVYKSLKDYNNLKEYNSEETNSSNSSEDDLVTEFDEVYVDTDSNIEDDPREFNYELNFSFFLKFKKFKVLYTPEKLNFVYRIFKINYNNSLNLDNDPYNYLARCIYGSNVMFLSILDNIKFESYFIDNAERFYNRQEENSKDVYPLDKELPIEVSIIEYSSEVDKFFKKYDPDFVYKSLYIFKNQEYLENPSIQIYFIVNCHKDMLEKDILQVFKMFGLILNKNS